MKDDLNKYDPDVRKVLAESTPERIKERWRKAVEKLVDAGLIDRVTPPPEGHPEAEPPEGATPGADTRASAPSPWAAGAGSEIDKGELPSAMAPAAPPEERPVTKA